MGWARVGLGEEEEEGGRKARNKDRQMRNWEDVGVRCFSPEQGAVWERLGNRSLPWVVRGRHSLWACRNSL